MSKHSDSRRKGAPARPQRVTLRALYASAMEEVMADPAKAIAEHDPCLSDLMTTLPEVPSFKT